MRDGRSPPDGRAAARRGTRREVAYIRLRSDARLELDRDVCLGARHPQTRCRQCADACAPHCLQVDEQGVRLEAGCVDCGRCVAGCPTRALSIPGFALPETTAPEGRALFVDCWRVPAAQTPEGGYRVPCLGGLSVSRLLALYADRKGVAPVVLLDRGWCGECAAWNDSGHPAAVQVDDAAQLLQSVGVPDARTPHLSPAALPNALASPVHPDPLAHAPLSRRRFFGSAVREMTFVASGAAISEGMPKTPPAAVQRVRPVERMKRLSLLADIAAASGTELPASLFPAVDVSEACADHQVCAGVCPTGALSGYSKDGASGLRFDPRRCIDCGACEHSCPEQALHMDRQSVPGQAQVERPLTRHLQRTCNDCGTPFSARNGASLCPQCLKRTELARAGFSLAMSARRAAPSQRA